MERGFDSRRLHERLNEAVSGECQGNDLLALPRGGECLEGVRELIVGPMGIVAYRRREVRVP
jgi:hypothetical protein